MARFYKKQNAVLNKKPGEMVYVGRNPRRDMALESIAYDRSGIERRTLGSVDELENEISRDTISWINIEGIADPGKMQAVSRILNLPAMIAADIMNTSTRPKYQKLDKGLYITLKMLNKDGVDRRIQAEQVSFILYENCVITFQEAPGDVFDPIRMRLEDSEARIRREGTEYLLYSLLDSIVDNYIGILQGLAEEIEDLEEMVIENPDKTVLEDIIFLKKELLYLGKSIRPVREGSRHLMGDFNTPFYFDLDSHIVQIIEMIDLYKEITKEQLNLYNAHVGNKLNEIMKVLTIFSVVFLPLSLLAGIYGTNFSYLPELQWRYSYFFFLGLMAVIAGSMILFFKKKKWL